MTVVGRYLNSPLGALLLSSSLSAAAGAAIITLGAPVWILVAVAWGGALVYGATAPWLDRRLGRR